MEINSTVWEAVSACCAEFAAVAVINRRYHRHRRCCYFLVSVSPSPPLLAGWYVCEREILANATQIAAHFATVGYVSFCVAGKKKLVFHFIFLHLRCVFSTKTLRSILNGHKSGDLFSHFVIIKFRSFF